MENLLYHFNNEATSTERDIELEDQGVCVSGRGLQRLTRKQ